MCVDLYRVVTQSITMTRMDMVLQDEATIVAVESEKGRYSVQKRLNRAM